MHEKWTDQLSDFLDGELTADAHATVEAHLKECASCNAVLNDLKGIAARAQALDARPPATDLWPGVAARIERIAQPRRVSLTLPQLAAAAVLLMAISGAAAVKLLAPAARQAAPTAAVVSPSQRPGTDDATSNGPQPNDVTTAGVSYADAQYDAAVTDLEKALKAGRGRLDQSTIDVVEHNLQIIDQAIAQARDALAADPSNAYLSGHLVEARRRKLDLLRRAAALADTD